MLRTDAVMPLARYWDHFAASVRNNDQVVFHNADLYAPHYSSVRSVSWVETERAATTKDRLQPLARSYPLHQYFLWSVSETPLGKERREKFIDPLLYLRRKVHWRNFEAGYDVAELEPPSRQHRTYVLQEYFVPVGRLLDFVPKMAAILQRHRVNASEHLHPPCHAGRTHAAELGAVETFAFVLYYKQRTRDNAKARGPFDARAHRRGPGRGRHLLPPLPAARHRPAVPQRLPQGGAALRTQATGRPAFSLHQCPVGQVLPAVAGRRGVPDMEIPRAANDSSCNRVSSRVRRRGAFGCLLPVPAERVSHAARDRFHHLIAQACRQHADEKAIYDHIQAHIAQIRPVLSDLRYSLPALATQKKEMTAQTLRVLGERRKFNGYAEIGSKGRYFAGLARALVLVGPTYFVDEKPPSYSPVDIMERGRWPSSGSTSPGRLRPLPAAAIADASLDLVTCYIGLHHMTMARLTPFLASIGRVLRPGVSSSFATTM